MREETAIFDDLFRERLTTLFVLRRDVRRFRPDPLPAGALDRLLGFARLAPSVGLSQPWRFVVVESDAARARLKAVFTACNADARLIYDSERASRYAALKLEGIDDAPAQVAVFCAEDTQVGHRLGRLTMPETAEYSVVTAIHTIWLAARAEGIGVGWVSILDPAGVAAALDVPADWRFVGHLCIGYPRDADDTPELERAGWEERRPVAEAILRR